MSVVRNSKFRHVFGQCVKRDNCYENIRVSRSSLDSMACAVNPKFLAVIVESGGGAFIVLPLAKYGRVPPDYPLVDGHKGYITDIAFCPHDDNVIASASDDCTVKVWQIPEEGLSAPMTEPVVDLVYHQRRVNLVLWHPSANNVLLSAGSDNRVAMWDVGTGEVLCCIESHPDVVFSACWNWNGSRLVTTCKDKKMRVFDPRTGEIEEEAVCHEGTKATRAIYLKNGLIFTTGFSKMSEWQYSLRAPGKLNKPLCLQSNDSTNGIIFPLYDPDTNMVFLCGKGDSLIRYFEITDEAPYVHFINIFTTSDPQRGIGMMPKRGCDVRACEVASFYRLNASGLCQVISMKCPRKSELFQEDLFPPTQCDQPALSASEWISGSNADPVLMSLRFTNAGLSSGAAPPAKLPNVLNRMRASSYVDIPRGGSSDDDSCSLSPRHVASTFGNRLQVEGRPTARPRSQSGGYIEDTSGEMRSPRVLRKAGAQPGLADVVQQVAVEPRAVQAAQAKEVEPRAVHAAQAKEVEPRAVHATQRVIHVTPELHAAPREVREATEVYSAPREARTASVMRAAPAAEERGAVGGGEGKMTSDGHAKRLHAQLRTWPKCSACEEVIVDEEYTSAEGKVYHVRHFGCSICDKPLAGNDYYLVIETDLPMCVGCYQRTFIAIIASI